MKKTALCLLLCSATLLLIIAGAIHSIPANMVQLPSECARTTPSETTYAECESLLAHNESQASLVYGYTRDAEMLIQSSVGLFLTCGLLLVVGKQGESNIKLPRDFRLLSTLIFLGLVAVLSYFMFLYLTYLSLNISSLGDKILAGLGAAGSQVVGPANLVENVAPTLEALAALAGTTWFVSRLDGRSIRSALYSSVQLATPFVMVFTFAVLVFDPQEALLHLTNNLAFVQYEGFGLVTNLSVFVAAAGFFLVGYDAGASNGYQPPR